MPLQPSAVLVPSENRYISRCRNATGSGSSVRNGGPAKAGTVSSTTITNARAQRDPYAVRNRHTAMPSNGLSRTRPEHEKRRVRPKASSTLGDEKPVKLRHEQRRPRAGFGGNPGQETVSPALASKHVDAPAATTDVDTLAPAVEEHVVGVAARLLRFPHRPDTVVEQREASRTAVDDSNGSVGLVPRHGEVRPQAWHMPGRGLLAGGQIHDGDLTGIRHVGHGPASVRFNTE